ncbi:MAG: insulinase family protein [Opitutales bacterium]
MLRTRFSRRFLSVLASIGLALLLPAAELPEKHPLDKSETRTFTLENGLRVALVSDPDLNMASASMSVGVGSYANPPEAQGLAHFLEHMLFLGTEKFPDEAEYDAYLDQNGGYHNAYTASDHTNYHFEVFPRAFEGALDRFSQFFIAPLFTEEFTARELNAVDSEFAKNREDDDWRTNYLFNLHVRADHPQNQFSTGNLQSLQDVRRETLIDFYEEHYSADQMALSLVSPLTLDQMEAWVREYFAPIPNQERVRLLYPADVLEQKEALRLLQIQSTEDRRELSLVFPLPSLEQDWDAKTASLVSHIVGYEGEGSLLSDLKEAGLASGLGGSVWSPTRDYAWLYVTVDLTSAGLADYDRVMQMVLGYFKAIREEPFPEYIYEEMATMARLDELYADKGEGAQRAVALANRALEVPLEKAIRAPYLFERQDPALYQTLLEAVSPQNMLVMLMARSVETDQVEPIYGTEYSYAEITGERFEALVEAPVLDAFTLPAPNPFVPESVALVPERPIKLLDRPDLELFYGQDTTFQRPKVAMTFNFRPVWEDTTVRDDALLDLYQACFYEAVNELGYAARAAGANYALSTSFDGVALSFSGYSESVATLAEELVAQLRSFELTEDQFAAVKDRLLRGWQNAIYGNAFRFMNLYQRQVAQEAVFLPWQKAPAAEDLTLEDVYAFRDRLFARGRVESLAYGNLTPDEAIARAESVVAQLDFDSAREEDVYATRLLQLEPGADLVFEEVLPSNNSCFRTDIIVGDDNPTDRMALAIAANLLSSPYYAEMRTRQQLGYVVWSGQFLREDRLTFLFLIQSSEYTPVELKERSDALAATFPQILADLPAEAFAQARDAVRSELEKKPTSIAEKAAEFAALAFAHDEDWNRTQAALDALDEIEREDVIALVERVLDDSVSPSTTVFLYARQHADTAEEVDGIENILEWKEEMEYEAAM